MSEISRSSYVVRNYRSDDLESYVRLNLEVAHLAQTERLASAQLIVERLSRPNFYPEQHLFVVETAGSIVGYLEVTPELKIGRVILDCLVHPKHRRRGLATTLLARAMHATSESGARVAHVNILQDNPGAANLLSKLGFTPVRRFLELSLDLSGIDFPDTDHWSSSCCHLKRGEEEKLARIQNLAFTGTWGYNPNTPDEIAYLITLADPEDVILICEDGEPIGYCWTRIEFAEGEGKGRIYMTGVHPEHRGRGVGKGVLLAGLRYLAGKKLKSVDLTVDSENTVACALYQSLGFKVQTTSLWYEKSLQ
ncbi:GNAT family N-acetyltransferase [Dehalococcoidia bacterium]|nr:GNAT family N-acetyltransferase [Dehalococcoidia bacterium]MCL0072932.1 GNAT family N-acetyltransferase [Dehalococcoidia bacterium]